MMRSPEIRSALPHTRILNQETFSSFLKRYGKIIIKPSGGSGGIGVIQVSEIGNRRFNVHYGKTQKVTTVIQETFRLIRYLIRKNGRAARSYLVQQRIPLAEINGKPFDVRVMVQKRGSTWYVTAMMAKIGGKGYFITNLALSKGRALPFSTAIRHSNIRGASTRDIQRRIKFVALKTLYRLQKYYRIQTVGLDIGIDTQGKVWIIEANFTPDKSYFNRLKDKTMYRRVIAYYKRR